MRLINVFSSCSWCQPFAFDGLTSDNNILIDTSCDQVAYGAKLRGASRIIGVDTKPEKCEKGKLDILWFHLRGTNLSMSVEYHFDDNGFL